MKQECPCRLLPSRLLPSSLPAHPAPKLGCASASLLGTAEGTETPVERGEQSLAGGEGTANTSQTPPSPCTAPPPAAYGRPKLGVKG